MTAEARGRLLIVDDEKAQMQALCDTLRAEGYSAVGYNSAKQAVASFRAGAFDLVLTDLMMPEMDGITLLSALKQADAQIAGILMTGHGTIDTAVKAMQVGALDYIVKPFQLRVILPVLARALEVRRLRLENAALQERERQHIRELEAANGQLEAFASSVSHDLRSPLNAIAGFCDVYIAKYGEHIPAEGREMLGYVLDGAGRMNQLIDDLLRFCRFSRQPLEKRRVPLMEIVLRVLACLQPTEEQRKIELRLGALPECEVDPSLMEQVYMNLLSNAYKFTGRRDPAVIEVGSINRADEVILFVRDNGAGFDMKYADKLFGVFQRLHPMAEFDGTGIGLSIVQQVIARHGGRIWAESAPDQGATFFFTLAPAEPSCARIAAAS